MGNDITAGPFVKLSCGITKSSVWFESPETRVVWIALLTEADQYGFVRASYPGMLHIANVPKDSFDKALKILESPDQMSRTTDYDGRRIERVDGGWKVLNYEKYRQYSYSGTKEAERKRKQRERKINELDDKNGTNMGHVPKGMGHSASSSSSLSCIKEGDIKGEKKHRLGEYKHVLLKESEMIRFIEKHGKALFDESVKILDEAIEMKGYKYKNHNLVLQKWPLEKAQKQTSASGQYSTDDKPVFAGDF